MLRLAARSTNRSIDPPIRRSIERATDSPALQPRVHENRRAKRDCVQMCPSFVVFRTNLRGDSRQRCQSLHWTCTYFTVIKHKGSFKTWTSLSIKVRDIYPQIIIEGSHLWWRWGDPNNLNWAASTSSGEEGRLSSALAEERVCGVWDCICEWTDFRACGGRRWMDYWRIEELLICFILRWLYRTMGWFVQRIRRTTTVGQSLKQALPSPKMGKGTIHLLTLSCITLSSRSLSGSLPKPFRTLVTLSNWYLLFSLHSCKISLNCK